jgi:hypothetical protein
MCRVAILLERKFGTYFEKERWNESEHEITDLCSENWSHFFKFRNRKARGLLQREQFGIVFVGGEVLCWNPGSDTNIPE